MRRRRYYSTHPPMSARRKAGIICFLVSLVLVTLFLVFMFHLKGVLSGLAVTRVSNSVNRLVTEAVDDLAGTGAARVSGQIWSAKPARPELVIPVGSKVRVLSIQGVKVLVEPLEEAK